MSEPGPATVKVNNFVEKMKDGRTRLVFLGGLSIAFISAVVAFNMMGKPKANSDASTQLESVPTPQARADGQPQPVNTKDYERLTSQSDEQYAQQAKQDGGSAMPVPRVGQAAPAAPEPAVMPESVDGSTTSSTVGADGQQSHAQQQREKDITLRYEEMGKQFDLLVKRWTPGSGREPVSLRAPVMTEAVQPTMSVAATNTTAPALFAPSPQIRANEAFLAVAMSEANTDDALPMVRARILNGPAKGATLMGTIQATEDAPGALVRFARLTPADGGASVQVDAVAIDPRTSRSSVASDVNRHTISRMAALFTSSILGGVSEGLLQGGQQENIVTSGQNVVVQRDAYTDRDLALIGLGKVGTNGAQMMSGAINRKPTVKLNLNTEIGVLFLTDVVLMSSVQQAGNP